MNELINLFVSDLSKALVLILSGVVTTFAVSSYKHFMDWIDDKRKSTNNDVLQQTLWALESSVKSVVAQAEQTLVIKEKDGNGGKLSPQASEMIRNFVIATTKNNMPNNMLEILSKYGVDINSLIVTFIEQSVIEGKRNKVEERLEPPTK